MSRSKSVYLLVASLATCLLLTSFTVIAAKPTQGGNAPAGKPFTNLRDELSSVENRVSLIESSILDIQTQINSLVTDASSLEERVGINEQLIASLQSENGEIKARLTALEAEATAMGVAIDLNSDEIKELISKHQSNADKIYYMEQQIADLEAGLDGKQDILTGHCEDGWALVDITPDGAVTCKELTPTVLPSGVKVRQYIVTDSEQVPPSECTEWFIICIGTWTTPYGAATAGCPKDTRLTGGGADFEVPFGATSNHGQWARYTSRVCITDPDTGLENCHVVTSDTTWEENIDENTSVYAAYGYWHGWAQRQPQTSAPAKVTVQAICMEFE